MAWLLRDVADITLYETENRFGGHSNTVMVDQRDGSQVPVDTGFIVFNDRNYPNLVSLFEQLEIDVFDTVMSFAVSEDQGRYEYSGSGPSGLFAQRKNVLSPRHWKMLTEIVRFNKLAKQVLSTGSTATIGEFLHHNKLGEDLRNRYLLPMAAAIWSCPLQTMADFPALSLCRFFENHGLLDLTNRPQWRSVAGGSRRYVERMIQQIGPQRCRHDGVLAVTTDADGVGVRSVSAHEHYDQLVFACHADDALALLAAPDAQQANILAAFEYQDNTAWLHTDSMQMPQARRAWSAWNYLSSGTERSDDAAVSVSYWMNLLQNLNIEKDYFVTLNPIREPADDQVVARIAYRHPVFTQRAVDAQSELDDLQGRSKLWYCGSYCGNGFHEDGIKAALHVVNKMGHSAPWQSRDSVAT